MEIIFLYLALDLARYSLYLAWKNAKVYEVLIIILLRACHQLEGRTLLKSILARYKEKNVLHSRATEVIFQRSRSLKYRKKLFFLIDDTP